MEIDPIKPTWKAARSKRLKPEYDEPLYSIAYKYNLRRYMMASIVSTAASGALLVEVVAAGVPATSADSTPPTVKADVVGRCRLTLSDPR